ncbi:hypothetical protein HMPREF0766_11658 [Sphingobacterium spiritivorum ATCC 33861]|uniref:Uncharacterized protein n=1 Tax=Sphingobacterium spiritivorum ATCC 33861 TaxID=525373 RepID=D7VKY9_SPHSI|nr:hypothetical protein HMPREF0766_11658 [Sphingobacterium spiritivorum ATCC 33861]
MMVQMYIIVFFIFYLNGRFIIFLVSQDITPDAEEVGRNSARL